MLPGYRDNDFDEKDLTCPDCGWVGKGHKANIIDLYGVSKQKEVHCPKCDSTIASIKNDDDAPGESTNDLSFQFG